MKVLSEIFDKGPQNLLRKVLHVAVVVVLCCVVFANFLSYRGYEFADYTGDAGMSIVLLYDWRDAGAPQGAGLERFMTVMAKYGEGQIFAVSNIDVMIDGKNYTTLFATKRRSNNSEGVIAVTTNGIVILKPKRGKVKVLFRDPNKGIPKDGIHSNDAWSSPNVAATNVIR